MRAFSRRPLVALAACAWAVAAAAFAQAPASPAGRWEGTIALPGTALKIELTLSQGPPWSGTIDIPAQGAANLPLGDVVVEGSNVAFALPGVPGSPAFTGALDPAGEKITGRFTQGGQSFPFEVRRKEDASKAAAAAFEGFDDFVRSTLKSWNVLERIDWNDRYLKRWTAVEQADERAKEHATEERKAGTVPAHPLEDYAGEYDHPAYGAISITRRGEALAARFHDIPIRLDHGHYDTFRGAVEDKALSEAELFIPFDTDVNGEVVSLSVPLEPHVQAIVFRKRPPAWLSDAGFLKRLVGEYPMADNPDFKVTVTLSGSTLSIAAFGQPAITLEPAYETAFALKGLSGFSARFVTGESGPAASLKLIQPNGVFTLNRISKASS